jgi:glycerophosphoryl diester phosphodiesterase
MSGVTVRRVGHKGADHIAPGNTTASFDAALAHAVDMIEFDVLPERRAEPERGQLILAHDYKTVGSDSLTLEQGLAHLASSQFADVELDVDLKMPGYEHRVVDALRRHRLLERALVSTLFMRSLIVLRELEPRLRLGWSVPRVRRDYTASPVTLLPAYGLLLNARRRLPRIAADHVRAGRCDALMAHWKLVTPRLVRTLHDVGGDLYVWTVDDPARIRALEALGVTGVITNDPRLFTEPASAAGTGTEQGPSAGTGTEPASAAGTGTGQGSPADTGAQPASPASTGDA